MWGEGEGKERDVLVVKRNGEREHTSDGVWKFLSRRLQCIYIQNIISEIQKKATADLH
jgi:hypothetical protein